jgi:hypothetical protein
MKEGVSGTTRHEGAMGRPVARLGRDGAGSGGARQGKIGGGPVLWPLWVAQEERGAARSERKEVVPALNE